jgi:hypothetical protein
MENLLEQYATDFNVSTFGDARASADLASIAHWVEQCLGAPAARMRLGIEFVRSNARVETGFVEELLGHLGDFERGGMRDRTRCRLIVPLRLDDPARVVAAVQRRLKARFAAHGLLIAPFPASGEQGFGRPGRHPPACPVPLIAIRHRIPVQAAAACDDPGRVAARRDRFPAGASPAAPPYEQTRELAQ